MNSTTSIIDLRTNVENLAAEFEPSLIFVDDASYEFVGGGMAANGI